MLPRVPIHLQNPELAKSFHEDIKGATDYKPMKSDVHGESLIKPQYRTPPDRVNGNELFRRLPNGDLDFQAAKHIVLDALNRAKYTGPGSLNDSERAALSCLFPGCFSYVDSGLIEATTKVVCKITEAEKMTVAVLVAAHLATEENYNAGRGGGSVPGSETQKW